MRPEIPNQMPDDSLIRLEEVLRRIPVSRSSFYAGQKLGIYPSPVKIGPRASAYRLRDIREFIADPAKWMSTHRK